LKASDQFAEVAALNKEALVVTAVGAVEAVFSYFASNGNDWRFVPSSNAERALGNKGLRIVLSLAGTLYPAQELINARAKGSHRWQGDWLMGLARIVQMNPEFVRMMRTPGSTRQVNEALSRIRGHQVMGKYGPEAWKASASSVAGELGSTMGSNEVIRSYFLAVAFVEGYNKRKTKGKLALPKPLRKLEPETTDILEGTDALDGIDDDVA